MTIYNRQSVYVKPKRMAGPIHVLPMVFSMALMAIARSSASIQSYEDRAPQVHLQRRTMGGARSKPLTPLDTPLTALSQKLNAELGRRHPISNLTTAVPVDNFYTLNSTINDLEIAQILNSVFELRLLDTQASVRRARQMLDLVRIIAPAAQY